MATESKILEGIQSAACWHEIVDDANANIILTT